MPKMQLKMPCFGPATMALAVLSVFAATPGALKADDMSIFGEITGVSCQGAADKAFPGFAVSSFSLGAIAGQVSGGGASASSRTQVTDIGLVKALDDCTPLLFRGATTGDHYVTATIKVVPKGSKTPVLQITLQDVSITSEKFNEGEENELDEVVTLSYGRITITHVPSGKTVTFDVRTNRAS